MKTTQAVEQELVLSPERKAEILSGEIKTFANSIYLDELLVPVARRLDDKRSVEGLDKELDQFHKTLDSLKKRYAIEGGKVQDFQPSDEVKEQILTQAVLLRLDSEYLLKLRATSADDLNQKELAKSYTEELARTRGYIKALKAELKSVQSRIARARNGAGAFAGQKAN